MTGLFIVARLGSTRLKEKHLIEADKEPFIRWLVQRFVYEFKSEIKTGDVQIFLTTSDNPENNVFEKILQDLPVTIFYGSETNIPLRQLQCAEKYNVTEIISLDGDDVLCSSSGARLVWDKLVEGNYMAQTSGLPFGMNISGYKSFFLKESLRLSGNTDKLETGWGRIFDKEKIYTIVIDNVKENKDLRFTLDYDQDAEFFKHVIESLGKKVIEITDNDLINHVQEKELYKINCELNNIYWDNFLKQKKEEDNYGNFL